MATACWASIVAKSTLPDTGGKASEVSLRGTNKEIINRLSTGVAGMPKARRGFQIRAAKAAPGPAIHCCFRNNPAQRDKS
jgi:hypothetical protein